jgi:hypothetical protein
MKAKDRKAEFHSTITLGAKGFGRAALGGPTKQVAASPNPLAPYRLPPNRNMELRKPQRIEGTEMTNITCNLRIRPEAALLK